MSVKVYLDSLCYMITFASLLFFSVLWILPRKRSNKFSKVKPGSLLRCEICGYTSFVADGETYNRCSVCGSINKKRGGLI